MFFAAVFKSKMQQTEVTASEQEIVTI